MGKKKQERERRRIEREKDEAYDEWVKSHTDRGVLGAVELGAKFVAGAPILLGMKFVNLFAPEDDPIFPPKMWGK